MENKNLSRIQSVSGKFNLLFTILIISIPVLVLLYWMFFNSLPDGFKVDLPFRINQTPSFLTLASAFLVSLIPTAVAIYGLLTLKTLFSLYENAIVFSARNVSCFRRLGYTLIYFVIAEFIYTPLLGIVLTFNNPKGERLLVVGLGSNDIAALIIGTIVLVISWVMNEACKLNDEQAFTV